ncbi:DUF1361 domain-containing protein [Mangrovimonas sp. TPBH4]|uniref:DUF1361 domain-containing protein n=1 Tax=Mangrovimonas sp. TPBH4 TaxID=1645914 RepID=UPI0009EA2976|nr:DUF1361 domain-containing protein [Mangrovimonas sp. TPBH4]
MNNIKYLLFSRFKIIVLPIVAATLSIILLMVRMKLTYSFYFLFLVWNLFLAIVPFAISTYIRSLSQLNKFGTFIGFGIWLLFAPNAPYIITDLFHLKNSSHDILWLDVLIVSSFSLTGVLLFFLSLLDIELIMKRYWQSKTISLLMFPLFFVISFGMYLGRYLRFNSWEIIQHPLTIFNDIWSILIQPNQHLSAWTFTISFGIFLGIGYWLFKSIRNAN